MNGHELHIADHREHKSAIVSENISLFSVQLLYVRRKINAMQDKSTVQKRVVLRASFELRR